MGLANPLLHTSLRSEVGIVLCVCVCVCACVLGEVYRRPVWDTAGLHHSPYGAQVLPSEAVPDQASLPAQESPLLR